VIKLCIAGVVRNRSLSLHFKNPKPIYQTEGIGVVFRVDAKVNTA
jgi:hypothetical protein